MTRYTKRYWLTVLNASLCRFFILQALCDGPAHGYEIIRRVAEKTNNFCVPSEGTIYPVLRQFLRSGCVKCQRQLVNGRQRKVYTITPKGLQACRAGAEVWQDGLACVKKAVRQINK
jgi:DNA-binding PadR family transcriptional regulator